MTTGTAAVAGLRCVCWINQHDRHASVLRFISDVLSELVERPTVVLGALGLADPRPLPDAGQIFESNLPVTGRCRLDELLADSVVNRAHMPSLPARQAFQGASGALRPFGLKRAADFTVVAAELLDRSPFIDGRIGIDRDTMPAQIDTQRACAGLWTRGHAVKLDMQEERSIAALDQCRAGRRAACQSAFLVVAKDRLQALPTVKQGQTEGPIPFPEAEDALIVVNRCGRKRRMGFGFDFQDRAHPRNRPDGQVGRESEAGTDLVVAGVLDLDLVARMDVAGDVRNDVAAVGKGTERRVKVGALLGSRHQFTSKGPYGFHTHIITYKGRLKPWKAFPLLALKCPSIRGLKPSFW